MDAAPRPDIPEVTRDTLIVGVLSDTHGHLYPEVRAALAGVDHIVHAGDIGSPQVLAELRAMAPVTAVRGNCDYDAWALALPVRAEATLAGARFAVGHVRWQVEAGGFIDVVIFGHSHQPLLERRQGVLYLNPGSAGPRRFNRPRSLARVSVVRAQAGDAFGRPSLEAEIVNLD